MACFGGKVIRYRIGCRAVVPLAALLFTTSAYQVQAQSVAAYPQRERATPTHVVSDVGLTEVGSPRLLPESAYSERRHRQRSQAASVNPYQEKRMRLPDSAFNTAAVQPVPLSDGSVAFRGFDALVPSAGTTTATVAAAATAEAEPEEALPTLTLPPLPATTLPSGSDAKKMEDSKPAGAQEALVPPSPSAPAVASQSPESETASAPVSAAPTSAEPSTVSDVLNSFLKKSDPVAVVPAPESSLPEVSKAISDVVKSEAAAPVETTSATPPAPSPAPGVEKIVDPTIPKEAVSVKSEVGLPPLTITAPSPDVQAKAAPMQAGIASPPSASELKPLPLPLPLPQADSQMPPSSSADARIPLPEKATPSTGSISIVVPGLPDQTVTAAQAPEATPVDTETAAATKPDEAVLSAAPKTVDQGASTTASVTPVPMDTSTPKEPPVAKPQNVASEPAKVVAEPEAKPADGGETQRAKTETDSLQKADVTDLEDTAGSADKKQASEEAVVVPEKYAMFNDATRGKIIDRVRKPNEKLLVADEDEVIEHEDVGIKIAVRRPSVSSANELEQAYDLVANGDLKAGAAAYEAMLENNPRNKNALFGAATTYQKLGNSEKAKGYYQELLRLVPNSREALNNYLALVGESAPEEALKQLSELEEKNPNYSPIPAQMSLIYQRMGDVHRAITKMNRAVSLSPDNTTYLYNLAILLDRVGEWPQASALYQQLIEFAERGDTLPARQSDIQERLTFIRSNSASRVM